MIYMKHQTSIQTASYYRRRNRQRGVCTFLRIVMIAAVLVFVWFIDLSCAFGWIKNAKAGANWPADFVGYGEMMITASVLLTIAAVLIFLRRNWIALGLSAAGSILCMVSMFRVASYAADNGFYSRIMDMPVDRMYYMEISPTLIVFLCVAALAFWQHFSLDARDRKKQEEEQKAMSILDENH